MKAYSPPPVSRRRLCPFCDGHQLTSPSHLLNSMDLCLRRFCSESSHVTTPYKLSFLLLL